MPRQTKARVKLSRDDKWRVVLTDTSPFEVPLLVSNDGFYKNLHSLRLRSKNLQKFVEYFVIDGAEHRATIPMQYNIVKDAKSIRTLSVLHPRSQHSIAEFYQRYEELICEYASRSPFSIRAPKKVGSSFFVPSHASDVNQYKNTTVDTTEIDALARNPASYFAYSGFSHLHKFFSSDDHTKLEKKYRYQLSLDISKCFDSIYTHSISWAVKSKDEAKDNIFAQTFGNDFDKVMQRLNHNETSGICIGPETSRIFAEIILARVDLNALTELAKIRIRNREDFECRRYVDNYYIFTKNEETAEKIEHELGLALREYNLHLNIGKREMDKRPFYSRKSLVVDQVNATLNLNWDRLFDEPYIMQDGRRVLRPKRIFKYRNLFGKFTREIKAACYASGQGYDAIANYVIGAIRNKATKLADDFQSLLEEDDHDVDLNHHRQLFYFLLDVGFYFFTLHPTVASSLRLSHALVRIAQHLQEHDGEGLEIVQEAALKWTSQLARAPSFEGLSSKRAVVPIELLNVLVSLQQFESDGHLEHQLIGIGKLDAKDEGYFHLMVKLFIYGNRPKFSQQRKEILENICTSLTDTKYLQKDAEAVLLLMDTLSCPHLRKADRADLLYDVWNNLTDLQAQGALTRAAANQLINEFEGEPWFIQWDGVDLLNMIEKKELSAVYA